MIPRVDPRTRLIALLGDPVEHSLSPIFQNAAFRAAGVPGIYIPQRTSAAELPDVLRSIAAAGGAGNVTLPHKEAAARAIDRRTEAVERTGACNTFWAEDGVVWGDNTDVAGFHAAAAGLLADGLAGARVLLLGAGGAARAVLVALDAAGAREVVLLNRTRSRAEGLVRAIATSTTVRVATDPEAAAGRFDLCVNATSLGIRADDPLPIDPSAANFSVGLDLVYARGGTAWVGELRSRGIPAADGLEMLIQQGAASFERWWGRPAPIEVMRAALAPAA